MHISDTGSTQWQEVLVSRPLFTSRNPSAVPLPHTGIRISLCVHGVEWLAVLDHSSSLPVKEIIDL